MASASYIKLSDIASRLASDSSGSSGSKKGSTIAHAPCKPRSHKQSPTEYPPRTFICDLCSRRFKRQGHLKRHHLSRHTQEKPFECEECGNRFSRKDNLVQHAKTHDDGNTVVKLEKKSKATSFNQLEKTNMTRSDDFETYGKTLFQIASEIPGSDSEFLSEEIDDQNRKKRKRCK
ncbi:C2H2 finger domain transcription factor sebA [Paramyrothecium foliicola]|nr:C2H2 finger domain transcription factor sebA [Paramyrothecium foliicola]